jgi:cytochrome c oxidase subunit II
MEWMHHFMERWMGLPTLASEHGAVVDRLLIFFHLLMIALFVGWSCFFLYSLWRFRQKRSPKADYHGARTHASTWLEVAVAVIELLLLFGLAVPFWARAVDKFPDEKDSTVIRIIGRQFNWIARYPGPDGVFGKADLNLISPANPLGIVALDANLKATDPAGQDDIVSPINEVVVPVNKPVIAYISSLDVIHSFKIVPFRTTQDAIPGMSIPVHFIPTKPGTYEIQCSQLCGNGHYGMRGLFRVVSLGEYEAWLKSKATTPAKAPAETSGGKGA